MDAMDQLLACFFTFYAHFAGLGFMGTLIISFVLPLSHVFNDMLNQHSDKLLFLVPPFRPSIYFFSTGTCALTSISIFISTPQPSQPNIPNPHLFSPPTSSLPPDTTTKKEKVSNSPGKAKAATPTAVQTG